MSGIANYILKETLGYCFHLSETVKVNLAEEDFR